MNDPVHARQRAQAAAYKEIEKALGKETAEALAALVTIEKAKPIRIAVVGKAGVGKTTTINSLFRVNWHISHTTAGTRTPQTEEFEMPMGVTLSVVDMPGLGEDIDQDAEFERMYAQVVPEVDVLVWVIQANARDLAEDQRVINDVISATQPDAVGRIVLALNQVDKIGPGDWNEKLNMPSPQQRTSIERRCQDIVARLSSGTQLKAEQIEYYSALRRNRLWQLLAAVVNAAGDLGWKVPQLPADPFELADGEVREFARSLDIQAGGY